MKAKLTKITGIYTLLDDNDRMVASDDVDMQKDYEIGKLSTKNCDEIFGVVDVEKIADRHTFGQRNHEWKAYIDGFNKALELNKDKVFSKGDMAYIMNIMSIHDLSFEDAIIKFQSLQQPTEIEVMIEMWFHGTRHKKGEWIPKLDSEGCLILTKKI